MTKRDVLRLLQSILPVLDSAGESQWAQAIERQLERFSVVQRELDKYRHELFLALQSQLNLAPGR